MLFGLQKAIRLTAGVDLLQFAAESWNSDPSIRIEDAYKWLFHATLGGEHAIKSLDGPRTWLGREWPTLSDALEGERQIVPLRRDGSLVRFNLRPYKSAGGDANLLLDAFVRSAKEFRGNREHFNEVWHMLGLRLQSSGLCSLNHDDWQELEELTKAKGYPAIDHSPTHLAMAKPAYRVLTRADAQLLLDV